MNKLSYFTEEIEYINDINIKESLKAILEDVPDYFFTIPASSTGKYHPDFALGDCGLVRHTKVAVRMAVELFGIYKFEDRIKDLIIFSLVLHDSIKKGIPEQKYTCFDHPILASNFIKEHRSILKLSDNDIEFICGCIESHMGRFNTSSYSKVILPIPSTPEQKFVHMCDYLASRKVINVIFDENNKILN